MWQSPKRFFFFKSKLCSFIYALETFWCKQRKHITSNQSSITCHDILQATRHYIYIIVMQGKVRCSHKNYFGPISSIYISFFLYYCSFLLTTSWVICSTKRLMLQYGVIGVINIIHPMLEDMKYILGAIKMDWGRIHILHKNKKGEHSIQWHKSVWQYADWTT